MATSEINIICPRCGHNKSTLVVDNGPNGEYKLAYCQKCQTPIKNDVLNQFLNPVTCPFCQSADCKKISGASKIGKVALFGVFAAGSVSKTWHCNNCGSNFG